VYETVFQEPVDDEDLLTQIDSGLLWVILQLFLAISKICCLALRPVFHHPDGMESGCKDVLRVSGFASDCAKIIRKSMLATPNRVKGCLRCVVTFPSGPAGAAEPAATRAGI
jgi:hypothetical protein